MEDDEVALDREVENHSGRNSGVLLDHRSPIVSDTGYALAPEERPYRPLYGQVGSCRRVVGHVATHECVFHPPTCTHIYTYIRIFAIATLSRSSRRSIYSFECLSLFSYVTKVRGISIIQFLSQSSLFHRRFTIETSLIAFIRRKKKQPFAIFHPFSLICTY